MVDTKKYGKTIRRCRRELGWTQAELANKVSVHPSAVAQWEQGWTEPRKSSLRALAQVFDIPIAELMQPCGSVGPECAVTSVGGAASASTSLPVQFDATLLQQAAELGIDVAAELSPHLSALIRLKRGERWLEQNRAALADANAFLQRCGLWSDGKRLF